MENGTKPRALIVEDDASFRAALGEYVRNEGFQVAMSPDLRQAREELAQGPPDVIFIDLNLPDGSGLDLIAAAGINGHLPETIMITGQASMETAVEALRNG